jgi:hypothetical protein
MRQHRHKIARTACLLLAGMLICGSAQAQQRMRYTQYLLNTFLTNPGVTGVEPYADIRAGFAQQWVGFKGAPRSIYVTANKGLFSRDVQGEDVILNSLPAHGRAKVGPTSMVLPGQTQVGGGEGPNFHMGVGMQLFSESAGPIAYNGLTGSFAAHLRLVGKLRMGLGASMEMLNYR